jgi:predicted nucleic acid-binding protein
LSAYADTSFLVSLYILDANSEAAAARMARVRLPVFMTQVGELELSNALSLRLFRKELVPSQVKAARALIAADIEQRVIQVKPLSGVVFERAKQISRKWTPRLGTRSLDVLHVASALLLRSDAFYTFDRAQARLAATEGLTVKGLG